METKRSNVWTWLVAAALSVGALVWLGGRYELVLKLKQDVPVRLQGRVPLEARIAQRVDIGIGEEIAAKVRLGRLEIPLRESLDIPLNLALKVPVDSEISIDEPLLLSLDVPIHTVLTERELDLSQLEVPIDTEVFVDDVLDVQVVVPLDSEVQTTLGIRVPVKANLPVKLRVPIRQKIHVRDRIKVQPDKLRIPLHATIPVKLQVKLDQKLRVRGVVDVPVRQTLHVPLHQTIHPELDQDIPVRVSIAGQLPAELKATLQANVTIDQAISTQLGPIRIGTGEIGLEPKTSQGATQR